MSTVNGADLLCFVSSEHALGKCEVRSVFVLFHSTACIGEMRRVKCLLSTEGDLLCFVSVEYLMAKCENRVSFCYSTAQYICIGEMRRAKCVLPAEGNRLFSVLAEYALVKCEV